MSGPRLVWERADGTRVEFPLTAPVMTVGRDETADIQVDEPLVSRLHARIERRGQDCVVIDLGSTNRTRVNGEMVHQRVLAHGDLMVSNLLGPLPLLVDWEYAQAAHPAWDFACLLSYYPWLETRLAPLLAWAGLHEGEGRERFRLELERFRLLNRLWERAYSEAGQGSAG